MPLTIHGDFGKSFSPANKGLATVAPVHPTPQSLRDEWSIKGNPIESCNATLCSSCLIYPSFPKGHTDSKGHMDSKERPMKWLTTDLIPALQHNLQGSSQGVPQHKSLSHLSIPSHSHKRDVWNIKVTLHRVPYYNSLPLDLSTKSFA